MSLWSTTEASTSAAVAVGGRSPAKNQNNPPSMSGALLRGNRSWNWEPHFVIRT